MYAPETLKTAPLTYLENRQTSLPYLLSENVQVELAPEITQLYDLARSFIFFEDQHDNAIIVVLEVTPKKNGRAIALLMEDDEFFSKRLSFNLGRAALEDTNRLDARNAHATNHKEWLRWVSAFYDSAAKLDAEADLDLYLISERYYKSDPDHLTRRAYANLRWHIDVEGGIYVIPVV